MDREFERLDDLNMVARLHYRAIAGSSKSDRGGSEGGGKTGDKSEVGGYCVYF